LDCSSKGSRWFAVWDSGTYRRHWRNSEFYQASTVGVLKIELFAAEYRWHLEN
jgi:hypothetical protein